MAKAAALNVNDIFAPPLPQSAPSSNPYGELLPTLASSAGPGPGSLGAAANRLSGQVIAVSSAKENGLIRSIGSAKRSSGSASSMQPNLVHFNDGRSSSQQSSRLPPLPQGYGPAPGMPGSFSSGSQHAQQPTGGGVGPPPSEPLQPLIQHPAMLPGPIPASHPYHPKRKPPSAFMRNNHLRHHLDMHNYHQSAGPSRSLGSFDNNYATQFASDQQQQYAEAVVAAAAEAMAQSDWGDGGAGAGGFGAGAPWGVSSVSDLEALDSILDQLVVVDARMRKALLKGPLISFETVVPEHILNGGRPHSARGAEGEDKDRTFLTAVKGIAEEGEEEALAAEEQQQQAEVAAALLPPPPPPPPVAETLPAAHEDAATAAAVAAAAASPTSPRAGNTGAEQPVSDPLEGSMFRPSIPSTNLHPTFTRAYLASKLASKAQLMPPPPPATAEHLLRSRPPAFIAAPTYDQLCSQIRDVQRQYTCGSSRPLGGSGGAAVVVATAPPTATALMANLMAGGTNSQYISGLDGPTLEEVVAHQDLPISLERVRPTFVALKQKSSRTMSPKRRGGGRVPIMGSGDGSDEGAGGRGVSGRRL